MKYKLQINNIKMKEEFGELEFGLTELCFPSLGLGHKHKLRVILISLRILIAEAKKVLLCAENVNEVFPFQCDDILI